MINDKQTWQEFWLLMSGCLESQERLHNLLLYAWCSFRGDWPGVTNKTTDTIRTITQYILPVRQAKPGQKKASIQMVILAWQTQERYEKAADQP